jgi:FixJ family two-component response regulator
MEGEMSSLLTESSFADGVRSASAVIHQREHAKSAQDAPTVFIVDPDYAVCESLVPLIAGEGWRLETFASAEDFLRRPLELVPSCLVLEVSLPGLSGLELQKSVAAQRPDIPIIFLVGQCDLATTVQAMKAGATEFLTKPFSHDELLVIIRESLERSRVGVARELRVRALRRLYRSLTLRERQVMGLVSSGWLNKQVGSELGISEITVKAHRGQVMRKMGAGSLPDLVRMAGTLGVAAGLRMQMYRNTSQNASSPQPAFIGNPRVPLNLSPLAEAKSA